MANVTTQVIERQIVRGLDKIISPVAIASMSDDEVLSIAAENRATANRRAFLESQIAKLDTFYADLRDIMRAGF